MDITCPPARFTITRQTLWPWGLTPGRCYFLSESTSDHCGSAICILVTMVLTPMMEEIERRFRDQMMMIWWFVVDLREDQRRAVHFWPFSFGHTRYMTPTPLQHDDNPTTTGLQSCMTTTWLQGYNEHITTTQWLYYYTMAILLHRDHSATTTAWLQQDYSTTTTARPQSPSLQSPSLQTTLDHS